MNATVVIPTYWAGDDACANAPGTYDHSTRLNADNPELDRCLASLEQVRDIPRIILLVVCPVSATADVSLRVHEIVDAHPTLKVTVVTNTQASRIADRVAQIAPKGSGECVSLRGYGAIRNMGLACAAVRPMRWGSRRVRACRSWSRAAISTIATARRWLPRTRRASAIVGGPSASSSTVG